MPSLQRLIIISLLCLLCSSVIVAEDELSLDYTFTLRWLGYHVVVNGDGTPVLTLDRRLSTIFNLTEGHLFTAGIYKGYEAFTKPSNLHLPPPLLPLSFGEKVSNPADFKVVDKIHDEKLVKKLWAVEGRKYARNTVNRKSL